MERLWGDAKGKEKMTPKMFRKTVVKPRRRREKMRTLFWEGRQKYMETDNNVVCGEQPSPGPPSK